MPWLSLATAAFEIGAAVWVLRGPGRTAVVRLTALLLVVLAGYQLAEVWVCADPDALVRARLAFCDIVWLPTIGLSLLCAYRGGPSDRVRWLLRACYAYCGVLCVWVLVDPSFVSGTVCSTILATFSHDATLFHIAYGAFYEAGLLALLLGAAVVMRGCEDPVQRAQVADLQMGTLAFVVPAFLTQIVWKTLDPALPSLMCHYALLLAVFLVRATLRERQSSVSSGP